jgi:predicted TIM-barrel fold metal-dependent hydrolase
MNTPWGDIAVSDAHVHFFSHKFFASLAQPGTGATAERVIGLLGWDAPGENPEVLAAKWEQELDRRGVSKAALIASVPGDEQSVIAALRHAPNRFYGYFLCNPCAPDALARAEAAFAGGMQGICFFPAMHRYSIQDARVKPLLDLAQSAPGRLAFVHCGVLSVGVRKKLGLASPFDMSFSNPIDLHAVALQYPKLNFVVPHFGAGYLREALMVGDLCPNIYLDTSSTNSWIRYQPESITLKDVFARALAVMGAGRLLFGTDSSFFPRGWQQGIFEEQVSILRELGVSPQDAARILGGNLERLLTIG